MCGILFEILYKPTSSILQDKSVIERIKNRGPNCVHSCSIRISELITLNFVGSVLWTQGDTITEQPLEDDNGVLLFNGDIYDSTWNKNFSDTQTIMQKLNSCNSLSESIIQLIKSFNGPFCLIYFDKLTSNIYFTRDQIGRGSLLLSNSEDTIVISSVLGRKYPCIEVPASKIYKLNILNKGITSYEWLSTLNQDTNIDDWVEDIQEVQNLPDDEFIVLSEINLDFSKEDEEIISFIETISKTSTSKQEIMNNILAHETILKTVQILLPLLEESIKVRLETHPNKCKNCLNSDKQCTHCTVGILFSGGLDCTILAYLADKYVSKDQPIDLINVAFETESNTSYEVPDRITGKKSYEELKNICSSRTWVFREVNVRREDLVNCQSSTIADLVYPRKTILDESLGSALWYAAWGCDATSETSCRVLLLGSGADELFGGYTRHRNVFKRRGWHGLAKELMLEWSRIPYRNLARDNRVIYDHGRIPRLPYLDENFSAYVLKLKPWLRCYPTESLGVGVGDKLLLRLLAIHLGLTQVATLPKRALQFGSRIANKKQKGSDIAANLK